MARDVIIKLGDFKVLSLNRENPMDSSAKVNRAYIRYNGMFPQGDEKVMNFEIGRYDGNKEIQEGHSYYLPSTENMIDCRVDTDGRKVRLKILEASPLEIKAKDLIERQTAVGD